MVMTAAERSKRYREKRDAVGRVGVTMTGLERDESVTKPKSDAITETEANELLAPILGSPAKATKAEVTEHILIEGEKVYGRQAVKYIALSEPWDTRPEPDDPQDMPMSGGRGLYSRADGSTYQVDVTGTAHDRNADGLIYADTDYKGVA